MRWNNDVIHQDYKPFKIPATGKNLCVWKKEPSGFWSKFTHSASRLLYPAVHVCCRVSCRKSCSHSSHQGRQYFDGRHHGRQLFWCPSHYFLFWWPKTVMGTAFVVWRLSLGTTNGSRNLVSGNRVWPYLGTKSLRASKGGPSHAMLLKAKWPQSGASWAPFFHILNSKDVQVLLRILL